MWFYSKSLNFPCEMDGKTFLNKFFPLIIILSFIEGVLSHLLPYLPFDLYSAFFLALIPLLKINIFSFLTIFLIVFLISLKSISSGFIYFFLYFIFFLGYQYLQKTVKTEPFFFKIIFISFSLLVLLFVRIYFFFDSLSLTVLDYSFWVNFLIKVFFIIFLLSIFL